jgi:hypothetical protein
MKRKARRQRKRTGGEAMKAAKSARAQVKLNGRPVHYTGPQTQAKCILFLYAELNFQGTFPQGSAETTKGGCRTYA